LPQASYWASYIVRIYRFQVNKPHALLGVVEEVGKKGQKAFTHYDELWEIFNSAKNLSFQEGKIGGRFRARRKNVAEKKGGKRIAKSWRKKPPAEF
jgi:hypothetical protein